MYQVNCFSPVVQRYVIDIFHIHNHLDQLYIILLCIWNELTDGNLDYHQFFKIIDKLAMSILELRFLTHPTQLPPEHKCQ